MRCEKKMGSAAVATLKAQQGYTERSIVCNTCEYCQQQMSDTVESRPLRCCLNAFWFAVNEQGVCKYHSDADDVLDAEDVLDAP